VFVICLAELKAKPDANHANAHPLNGLVVSNLQPAPRHFPRSRIWFQIRHHQDKSHANGCPWLMINWPAKVVGSALKQLGGFFEGSCAAYPHIEPSRCAADLAEG
jgi:hypothetical protein